ncbi:aminotransferase class I/II-fold pyridoxal phosphate-dependent enzyme [Cellulomonas endophytica]|uniref:aminotransferase class I/II-fold pyridoxal phosphate-dependent enzyme n=1 Tax=Cellulomonas endophytica TaxID=2494735 RepID=UPI001F0C9707|nr:aminotransferase class I/II-fold pyridoxal phosphate-dependent enzyme [Cellulomonas endophytica]
MPPVVPATATAAAAPAPAAPGAATAPTVTAHGSPPVERGGPSRDRLAGLVAEAGDRSPRGIAAAVARLVGTGELRPGDRLPTVRDLAAGLGVSPATVSGAFSALATVGLVLSRGRAGTVVLPPPIGWLPPRYRELAAGGPARVDLSSGTPDPELLPALGPALARAAAVAEPATGGGYLRTPLVPELEAVLRAGWPFPVERLTVVDGALDGLGRALEVVARYGDRVAVEDPGFPPVFDLLESLGLERVPLRLDDHGVRPDALAAALDAGATCVLLQPRAQNPTGVSLSPTRARELAAAVRRHAAADGRPGRRGEDGDGTGSGPRDRGDGPADGLGEGGAGGPGAGRPGPGRPRRVHVLEDDHSGEVTSARDVSLGTSLPGQVVHVRSYSKSHGPHLRLAAVGGPAHVLDALVARRMLGPGWTSRLLQRTLVDLLTDPDALDAVAHARRVYFARQRALVGALARDGLVVLPGDGVNLWLPVRDEAAALVHLEAAGIRVSRGSPYFAAAPHDDEGPHVRVTVGLLREDVGAVAAALALAARA